MAFKWSKGTRVVFKDLKIPVFLSDLAEKAVPLGIKVHVTSAYRSPANQARVVCNNFHNTGGKSLKVYGKTTRGVYQKYCPSRNMAALTDYETQKLARAMARDPNYQGHGTGWAVDLSVYNMSHATKVKYKGIIENLGAKVLWEKHPEHFHVWLKNWKPKVDYGSTRMLAYGGFGLATLLTGWLGYKIATRKRKEKKGDSNIHDMHLLSEKMEYGSGNDGEGAEIIYLQQQRIKRNPLTWEEVKRIAEKNSPIANPHSGLSFIPIKELVAKAKKDGRKVSFGPDEEYTVEELGELMRKNPETARYIVRDFGRNFTRAVIELSEADGMNQ